MSELDSERVRDYFSRRDTVAEWWSPDEGPLAFHYDAELQVLDDQLPTDASWQVLDVGTGRGRFGAHFAARGCRVIGVDLNPDMVEIARETARQRGVQEHFEVRQGSAEDLAEHGRERFDLVLCMELFDHLPDLSRVLAEMRGALKPQGRLAFTYVPSESLYGALGNVYRALRRASSDEVMISRTYRHSAVLERLADAGLRLEGHWGIGLLCLNAQTRLFSRNPLLRLATSVARLEARWRSYHGGVLAKHGAHVVGLASRQG